jgi:hypothetical protein
MLHIYEPNSTLLLLSPPENTMSESAFSHSTPSTAPSILKEKALTVKLINRIKTDKTEKYRFISITI